MDTQRLLLALHLFGFAIGVGGATVTDIFFMKFLKDFRISRTEADFMQTLSRILWIGVVILALTGLGLFLHDPARLLTSAKFLSKMGVVLVLLLNGWFLHFAVTPSLRRIAFHEDPHPQAKRFREIRQRAFISGGISIVSWYYAFFLAISRFQTVTITGYMALYVLLLVSAFAGALLMDDRLSKAAKEAKS
ncbi:hypothetical protein IPH19_04260 [Candidatus Uhrbacteria bacterium]|jgi:hypothetical protein|nr:MAG: hypothetical protein IPH19_04260 [Candidatus Uhrbacteria bacterium]